MALRDYCFHPRVHLYWVGLKRPDRPLDRVAHSLLPENLTVRR